MKKNFKNYFLVLILFFIITNYINSKPIKLINNISKSHVTTIINENIYVDWTEGEIYSLANLPLLSNIENEEQARINLVQSVFKLNLINNISILEEIKSNEELNQSLSYLDTRLKAREKNTLESSKKFFKYSLALYGKNGLYELISHAYNFEQKLPEIINEEQEKKYTSLVIDLKNIKNFTISLIPTLYDPQGLLIYAPEYLKKSCFIEKGPVKYLSSLNIKNKSKSVGYNPLIIYPICLRNSNVSINGSDLVISKKDSKTILSNFSTRKALQNCQVFIINSIHE